MIAYALLLLLSLTQAAAAAPPNSSPADCSKMSWQDCAAFTKKQLQEAKGDPTPERAIRVVNTYWAPAFEKAYLALGDPDKEKDAEKIIGEIESTVSDKLKDLTGYSKVKNKLVTDLLAKYLGRLAPIVAAVGKFLELPPIKAAEVFFWSSPIGGAAAELKNANQDVQSEFYSVLAPHLQKEWSAQYRKSLETAVGPKWQQGGGLH